MLNAEHIGPSLTRSIHSLHVTFRLILLNPRDYPSPIRVGLIGRIDSHDLKAYVTLMGQRFAKI
jgi:hypothetical protein